MSENHWELAICIPLVDLLRVRRRLCLILLVLALGITGIYLGIGIDVPAIHATGLFLQVNLLASIFVAVLIFLVCETVDMIFSLIGGIGFVCQSTSTV